MIKRISEGVSYQKLTEEEKKARGILGRLVGVCADFINPTRNGRKYSEQLWENVFNNPIMKEKIKNKVCYGELQHPADRTEIDPEKIAVCLAEQPVKNKNGQLEAVFDILDTPNGRILKALCDYGSTLGISSRGQGDLITDANGDEAVDPDTYECECWDIVLIPAVEAARLKYVTEGLGSNKVGLKRALQEAFNKESEEGKKIMAETLNNLNIKLDEAVKKEIKLSDCTKLTDAKTAFDVANKLKAHWCFGLSNSLGQNVGEKFFNIYKNQMDLYVYEDGANSICFGINPDNKIYGPFDVKDALVNGITILIDLNGPKKEEQPKEEKAEDKEEVNESLLNEMAEVLGFKYNGKVYENLYDLMDKNPEYAQNSWFVFAHGENNYWVIDKLVGHKDCSNKDWRKIGASELEKEETKYGKNIFALTLEDGKISTGTRHTIYDESLNEAKEDKEEDNTMEDAPDLTDLALDDTPNENDENDDAKLDNDDTEAPEGEDVDLDATEDEAEAEEEDTRTDQEIFIDYLVDNFDEEQIKKACKALGIDVPDEEAEEGEADDEEAGAEESEDDENSTDAEDATDEDKDAKEDEAEKDEDEVDEALDKGSAALVKSLQEALKGKSDLEALVKALQEQLAVSDAKANDLVEECNKYKNAVTRLAAQAKSKKDLEENVSRLEESLEAKEKEIKDQSLRIARLVKVRKDSVNESLNTLNESVEKKDSEMKTLKEGYENKIKALNEELNSKVEEAKKEVVTLQESLTKATTLKESYKNLATKAMNTLIEERANQLGLTAKDIKRKLGSTYTIDDVNVVCEELKRYQLNVSKLPFSVGNSYGVKVTEAVQKAPIANAANNYDDDDEVSPFLMSLANGNH